MNVDKYDLGQVRFDAQAGEFVRIVDKKPFWSGERSAAYAAKQPERYLTAGQLRAALAAAEGGV